MEQETVVTEKENLEKKLKEHKAAPATQTTKGTESELQLLREEVEVCDLRFSHCAANK
jgi:hypothetical protein